MSRPKKYHTQEECDAAQKINAQVWRDKRRAQRIAEGWIPKFGRPFKPKENLTPEQIAARNKIYNHRNYEKNKQNPEYVEARKKRAREWYYANKEQALKRMNEYHKLHRPYKTYEQTREYYLKSTEDKVTYRRKPYGPRKLKEKQNGT